MQLKPEIKVQIEAIENRWTQNLYNDPKSILRDYSFIANTLDPKTLKRLIVKSKAIADIVKSVQKYNKFI